MFIALRVRTLDESGQSITVFDLSDTSIFADSEWLVGQVEVYNRKVFFEAVMRDGEQGHGWVAVDNIMVESSSSGTCDTLPAGAQVTTVPPETTTPQGKEKVLKSSVQD